MKIALIGYGKMGQIIEEIALGRNHEIVCVIDEANQDDFSSEAFRSADVAIEFSRPEAAVANILRAFRAGVPVVSGTTGWISALPDLKAKCLAGEGTLLWSSNFSLGMNVFMAVNRYLASLMKDFPEYSPSMEETHHIHKLDHPSGTAITLAEQLIAGYPALKGWYEPDDSCPDPQEDLLPIKAIRRGEVPGIHSITWDSEADDITITHSAKSRRGFALGAVIAAEWLSRHSDGHTLYSMKDVLGF